MKTKNLIKLFTKMILHYRHSIINKQKRIEQVNKDDVNDEIDENDEIKEKKSDNAEAIRTVINLIINEINKGNNCVAVTSYTPFQGKTRILQSVAKALAEIGYKTLIIDANIISPYLSQYELVEGARGLFDFIDDIQIRHIALKYSDIMPYIRRLDEENLYFLPTLGDINAHYVKYIKKEDVQYILSILRSKFDIILVEAPTFNEISYTQSIVESTERYFLVIKEGEILKREVFIIKERLHQVKAELLGAILNKINE